MADYSVTGNPISLSRGASALIRVEFGLIQTAIATKSDVGGDTYTGAHDFTGATITVPTQAAADNTTKAASTAHVFAERTNAATLTNKTLTSPTINTPSGIVKGDVGLGNVDNTSDANKPISTATQTALDAKGAIAGQTWTGNHIFPTQLGTDTSTKAANMAAVQAALSSYIGTNLGLPTFTVANALQNLRINSAGDGYEWALLVPDQTSNSGKYLTTNGTATSWASIAPATGSTLYINNSFGGF